MPKPSNFLDISGFRFGRLVAVKYVGMRGRYPTGHWLCKCDCGKEKVVSGKGLRSGNAESCGCLISDTVRLRNYKHGMAFRKQQTTEYKTWGKMKSRCSNELDKSWPDYGGRGIKVCERWEKFENFLEDMGIRPSPKHSLDRINNDGDYEPSNCRWATFVEQIRNRRNTRFLTFNGKTQSLMAWSIETGLKFSTIADRTTYGWTTERILTTPPKK